METNSDRIFRKLDGMVEELSREDAETTVGEIIAVLKTRNISYGCAELVLDATQRALREMSQSIQL